MGTDLLEMQSHNLVLGYFYFLQHLLIVSFLMLTTHKSEMNSFYDITSSDKYQLAFVKGAGMEINLLVYRFPLIRLINIYDHNILLCSLNMFQTEKKRFILDQLSTVNSGISTHNRYNVRYVFGLFQHWLRFLITLKRLVCDTLILIWFETKRILDTLSKRSQMTN